MRKLVVTENITLDGVIDMAAGLRLLEARPFVSGAVLLRYASSGTWGGSHRR